MCVCVCLLPLIDSVSYKFNLVTSRSLGMQDCGASGPAASVQSGGFPFQFCASAADSKGLYGT